MKENVKMEGLELDSFFPAEEKPTRGSFSPLSTKKVACVYKPSIDHFFPKELERKIVLFRRKLAAAAAAVAI